jgi:DNA-binding XRE family transcriptional regulator
LSYLSSNIKHLRETLGLNQSDFGNIFNVSRDNIASYERGSEPKLEILIKIVNHFHITIEEIYNYDLKINDPRSQYKQASTKANPVNDPKGDYKHKEKCICELCSQKDETIEAMKKTIKAQELVIDKLTQTEKVEQSKPTNSGGQKRKAG